jgi:hypothetical protein
MEPVFSIHVDADDPHYFTIKVDSAGLAASNRYTLAGVVLRLLDEAQANAAGGHIIPFRGGIH